ncbi:MAG: hypothetical protein PHV13_06090 [Candidatus ainarchaeum sp.]|nr:hypothetical protein [Candidatus ainarchaeum sp.]
MRLGTGGMAAAVAICAILIAALFVLSADNDSLRGRLAGSQAALNKTSAEKAGIEGTLARAQAALSERELQVGNLTSRLRETEQELNATAALLSQAQDELNSTREELERNAISLAQARQEFASLDENLSRMEESLSDDVQWFRDNSELPASVSYFAPYVMDKCVGSGVLNLGCVSLFMEKRVGFNYIDEPNDRLYTIDEMVARGGGDCEDYSLFVKALLNSLDGEGLGLLGWKQGSGEFVTYRSDTGTYWYYHGQGIYLGTLDEASPYAICYLTDLSGPAPIGHCIVALAEGAVESVAGLRNLDGAVAFEPQNGAYMGYIGSGGQYHLCRDGEISCGGTPGEIFIVMADDDLYEFKNGRWESFGTYRAQAEALRERLAVSSP